MGRHKSAPEHAKPRRMHYVFQRWLVWKLSYSRSNRRVGARKNLPLPLQFILAIFFFCIYFSVLVFRALLSQFPMPAVCQWVFDWSAARRITTNKHDWQIWKKVNLHSFLKPCFWLRFHTANLKPIYARVAAAAAAVVAWAGLIWHPASREEPRIRSGSARRASKTSARVTRTPAISAAACLVFHLNALLPLAITTAKGNPRRKVGVEGVGGWEAASHPCCEAENWN